MKVFLSRRALADVVAHCAYIADFNPSAADRMETRIFDEIDRLIPFPHAGRVRRVAGTRELVITKSDFVAIYAIRPTYVEILRVMHGKQLWPSRF